ncbi:LTR-retrotransposon skipper [Heterostelium album PN500]|uniref:LTR-retrotransposon skipper n=1 Tax=Heterostelium pallidum (strain ATCC 26659 / Pp 5 / PN500) TaxID=670386 RepID=D3BPN8_HETP5|nr:LTR-retrotransposon skipper [Heterostelium album PN500]EFA76600.1 LTR-retrotransposon skipper [Heterostelium album PN500]|eukprot:XP_020428732.1 LTR-retrotransposon skipper [Heterostelium album PN500]
MNWKKQINTYLENGQITPSQSAFAKDGGWRLCVDYRSLNGITIKDTYPLPNITEVLNNTRDGVLFSKIDLLQGYHQIRVHENDQSKTAFQTSFGVFQYTVLPFGLTNAPACFQRLMDSIFQRHTILNKKIINKSKKFNTTEKDYHVFEQEVMAIKHALESNYHMLLGYKWLQYIFSFNPTLIYKKGSDNVIADGLSRYTYSTTISIDDNDLIAMIENGYIEEETQIKNKTIHPSKYYKSKSVKTEGKLKYFEDKIVIPQVRSIIKRILFIYHDSLLAGHHGIEQTLELISRHFIWEGIAKDVTNYVKACHTCNKATDARGQSIGKLQPLIVPTKCFESISMDFIPLIDTEYKGIKYNKVWVIVDRLSKMVRLIPVHSTYTSKDLAEIFMKEIFKHHGMPVEIVSDRDSKFTSKFWKDLMDILNCEIRTTTAENQQANGQVESIIRYLGNLFRKAIIATYNEENHDEWITLVDTIEFCVNNSIHHGCEYSPFKIYTGENPITPLSLIQYKLKMNSSNVDIENMINSKRNQLKIVRNWLFDNQYNMRIQYNKNKKEMDIKVGDSVYLRKFRSNPKNKIKLETRFDGPYEVTNVNGLNVTVANVESGTKRKRINPSFTRHAKYFKKHNSLDDEDDDDIEFGEVEEEDEIEIDSITQNEQNNQNNNNDDTDDTEAMDIDSELDLVTNNNSTTNNNPPINTPDSNTLILDNIPNSTTTHPIIHNTLTFQNEREFSESSEITNFQRISAKEIKEAFEKKNKLTVLEEYIQYHNSYPNHPPTKQSAKILIALINANIIRKDTMFVTRKRTFNLTNKRDAKTEYLFNIGGVQGWILDNDVHQSYKSLTGDYRNWLKTNSN